MESIFEINVDLVNSPPKHRRKEKKPLEWSQSLTVGMFEVNKKALQEKTIQISEVVPLDDITSNGLLDILSATTFSEESLSLWGNYSGSQIFTSKEGLRSSLENMISYCEENVKASEGLKNKLRLVTKMLYENEDLRIGILPLLAQHGTVCNVMKEVGVDMAYSAVKNEVKLQQEIESLRQNVLRELEILKEIAFEEMFKKSNPCVNTHNLIDFRNKAADLLGFTKTPDPDYRNGRAQFKISTFLEFYKPKRLLETIRAAIYQKTKKITPDELVDWLKSNSPLEDSYEFLTQCFDEDGKFTDACLLYFLFKLEILRPSDKKFM